MPNILSKSRLNRRLHDIPSFFWQLIVAYLSHQIEPCSKGFLIDSFPVAVCHNVRSNKRSLFKDRKYVGYNASKQAWFTGLKVHVLTTFRGCLREFLVSSASTHDLVAFKNIYLGSLIKGSIILGDKAYISAKQEKAFAEIDLHLITERRRNFRKGQSLIYQRYGKRIRKKIETIFSKISSWLPKYIHAVTNRGFVLKLMMLIVAFSMTFCVL